MSWSVRNAATMHRPLILALLTCLPVSAQRSLVVDPTGGTAYSSVAEALDAAVAGDTILLLQGQYPTVSINKGIRLIGNGPVQMAGLEIFGIPVGASVSVAAIEVSNLASGGEILVSDCRGSVHLASINRFCYLVGSATPCINSGMTIRNCSQVSLHDCILGGRSPIVAEDSHVLISECELTGGDAGTFVVALDGSPAIAAHGSHVKISGSNLKGGMGLGRQPFSSDLLPGPAIDMTGGTLEIGSGVYLPGDPNGAPEAAPSIRVSETETVVGLGILNCQDLGLLAGDCRETFLPTLRSTHPMPGRLIHISASAPEGSFVCIHFGPPAEATYLPFGSLWLDPNQLRILASGTVTNSLRLQVTKTVPSTVMYGETFTLHSAVLAGGELTLSLPITVIAR